MNFNRLSLCSHAFLLPLPQIMKRKVLYIVLICLLSVLQMIAVARPISNTDSIQISLLTCSPGQEVWAQYGHTAVRYCNKTNGEDIAINYGIFSPNQSYFIPRFILGLTDYHMGVEPMSSFLAQYDYEGRGVVEQVLDISIEDKEAILRALEENIKPENTVYRYNFFYDNCTTRARDLIVNHLHHKVIYPKAQEDATFRSMIHKWNHSFPWTEFGEDLLLGVNADRRTTKSEQQFLPENLKNDFEKAIYNGHWLVKSTHVLLVPKQMTQTSGFPIPPLIMALFLASINLIIDIIYYRKHQAYWIWDTTLLVLSGALGLIFFIMIFSQHPCVSLNTIILFFNPLPFLFLYKTIQKSRRQEYNSWWLIWGILITLGFIGTIFQYVPSPARIMALSLLIHCIIHLLIDKPTSIRPGSNK